jgi:hypothetical protein
MNNDTFSFPAGTLASDAIQLELGELTDSLRGEDGCYDVRDADHYGDQLIAEMVRHFELMAAYAEDATRFAAP